MAQLLSHDYRSPWLSSTACTSRAVCLAQTSYPAVDFPKPWHSSERDTGYGLVPQGDCHLPMSTANELQQPDSLDWVMKENFKHYGIISEPRGRMVLNRWRNGVTSRQGVEKQQAWRPDRRRSERSSSCKWKKELAQLVLRQTTQSTHLPRSSWRKRQSLGSGLGP